MSECGRISSSTEVVVEFEPSFYIIGFTGMSVCLMLNFHGKLRDSLRTMSAFVCGVNNNLVEIGDV